MKLQVASDLRQQNLLLGGPVNPDAVFVLHGKPLKWDSTVTVTNEIGLSTSGDILKAIASGEGPSNYLIALGYSGWNPGQLDEELTENVWIQAPTDFDIISFNVSTWLGVVISSIQEDSPVLKISRILRWTKYFKPV